MASDRQERGEMVRLLLAWGAHPNIRPYNGHAAVMNAVLSATSEILTLLLEAGANVNARNWAGWNAVFFADGKSALAVAIEKGSEQAVVVLAECGARR